MPFRLRKLQWLAGRRQENPAPGNSISLRGATSGAPWRWAILLLAALWIASNLLAGVALFERSVPRETVLRESAVALPRAADAENPERIDIGTITGWHLFGDGKSAQALAGSSLEHIEAPTADTALDLTLKGVIVANEPAEASAIVHVDGAQRRYQTGEELPIGNHVSLAKVLSDRAILRNGNRFETLWLYAPSSRAADGTAATASDNKTLAVAGVAEAEAAASEVVVLADVIEIAAHWAGDKLVGYYATPGQHAATFERLGLQPGDLITAVNGIDFEESGATLEHYNPLQLSPDATLVIRRGKEKMTLFVAARHP